MSINLKNKNTYKRIEIADIIFLQGEDFNHAMQELNPTYNLDYNDYSTELEKIEYMLQWHQDGDLKYMSNWYNAEHLNSPFLGYIRKIKGYTGYFLYTLNNRLDYMGLSKILTIE